MKLKSIQIVGYGKLVDREFHHLSSLQVVYGANEAGKSTMMSFIHSILFGFPTKQQTASRYEPKHASKYGGRLIVETEVDGEIIIERMKGKAVGDVTLYFQDGTVGGEFELQQLLSGMDKAMFQRIFSFDIHGLQGVHLLKSEEIGRYLLAAGTIGTDALLHAEQQLQKELDSLFKPNGRKPILNQQLQQLRQAEQELKKGKIQQQQYARLVAETTKIEKEKDKLQQLQKEQLQATYKLEKLVKEWPLIQERNQLQSQLNDSTDLDFPANGIARFEKMNEQLRLTRGQLNVYRTKRSELEKTISRQKSTLANHETRIKIDQLLEKWPQVQQWNDDLVQLQYEMSDGKEQIKKLKNELHVDDKEISQLQIGQLGMNMKEKIRHTVQESNRLLVQKQDILTKWNYETKRLEEAEAACTRIENNLLDEEAYRRLDRLYHEGQAVQDLKQQQQVMTAQIDFYQQRKTEAGEKRKKAAAVKRTIGSLAAIFFVSITVWSVIALQWMFASTSLLAFLSVLYLSFFTKQKKVDPFDHTLTQLKQEAAIIESELKQKSAEHENWKESYEQQRQLRTSWKEELFRLERQQVEWQETKEQLASLEKMEKNIEAQLLRIKHILHLPADFASTKLEDALDRLRESILLQEKVDHKAQRIADLSEKQCRWRQQLTTLVQPFLPGWQANETGIIRLKERLKGEDEQLVLYREAKKQLQALEDDRMQVQLQHEALLREKAALLQAANVYDEEAYWAKAEALHIYKERKERLLLIEQQLSKEAIKESGHYRSLLNVEQEQAKLFTEKKQTTAQLEEMHKRLANLTYEIKMLEEGGTYTEHLHHFYHLQSIYRETARRWMKYQLAKHLLHETMKRLKAERLPKVVKKAQEYFKLLTDGEYVRIHIQADDVFVIERKDRVLFEAKEVSQATKEQLYIALRFTLVAVLQTEYAFPIIIDDGFVNFDHRRTAKVIQLLKEFQKDTQVLFFTCHQHLLPFFSKSQIIELQQYEENFTKR